MFYHIHILPGMPPEYSVNSIAGCFKGKSSLSIISVGEMQGFGIATGNFGTKDTTLISKNTQRIVKSIRKKTPGKVCSHQTLPRLRRTGQPSFCQGVMPLRCLPAP